LLLLLLVAATCCTFLLCRNSLHTVTDTDTCMLVNFCTAITATYMPFVHTPSLDHPLCLRCHHFNALLSPSPSPFLATYAHNFALISFFSHAIWWLRVFFNFKCIQRDREKKGTWEWTIDGPGQLAIYYLTAECKFSFRCGFRFYLDSAFCMIMRQPASQWQLKVFGPEKQNYENLVSTLSLPMTKVQCTYVNELNTNTVKWRQKHTRQANILNKKNKKNQSTALEQLAIHGQGHFRHMPPTMLWVLFTSLFRC